MNTLEHLSKILPVSGLKVLAEMHQRLDSDGNPVFKSDGTPSITPYHKTFGSIEELAKAFRLRSNNGRPLYMALGGYNRERSFIEKVSQRTGNTYMGFSRSADFTDAFKAMWLDIDVGESKAITGDGYLTQEEAVAKVKQFVADLSLPTPMFVNSGGGVHVYWCFDKDVDATSWFKLAKVLDAIVKHYGLLADPSCTADRARVLRPIGTINHKYNKPVELISDAPSITFLSFANSLKPYYLEHKAEIEQLKVKKVEYVERKEFHFNNKPKHAKYFLKRCQVGQQALIGTEPLPEPVWRGVISILRHCENGEKHIETLRKKCKDRFPDTTRFDEDRTIEKLNWLTSRNVGPFTCDTFKHECAGLCEGCPYANGLTIRTPLTLAEHYEEIEVPQYNIEIGAILPTSTTEKLASDGASGATNVEQLRTETDGSATQPVKSGNSDDTTQAPQPPYPYKRTSHGLVVMEGDKEVVFFRGDMFPVMTRFVEYIDGERNYMVKFMMRVGLTGSYQEVSFFMKDWYAADRIKQKLGSVGISITEKYMQHLLGYLRKYLEHVGDDMDDVRQLQHFGWVDEQQQFLLGNKLYRQDGVVTVQPHINLKNYTRYFKQSGSLDEWKKLMARLGELNAVEQQICMLSSFGSTLMKFTNYNGIWLHLMTKPGYGKTTTQEMMNGIWGHPQDLLLNAKDTLNAIEERFGRWTSIGVSIDEVSNLDPMVASELLLGVTQGRTKQRLDTNMRERVNDLSWQLMVLSSGNFSLIDRINTRKEDVAAEISRTLEFRLPKPTLNVHDGELLIKKPIRENYGLAGAEWLSNLVKIPEYQLQELVDRSTEAFSNALQAKSEERFWVAGCAVMYVAGQLTNKMGLTNWNMEAIFNCLCEIVKANRNNRVTYEFSATDVLASFLNENTRNTVVTDVGVAEGAILVRMAPSGALNVRYEQDKGIIYVRTHALKEYCARRGIGINSVKETLEMRGLLENPQARIVMSKGLANSTGRTYCLAVKVDEFIKASLDNMMERRDE